MTKPCPIIPLSELVSRVTLYIYRAWRTAILYTHDLLDLARAAAPKCSSAATLFSLTRALSNVSMVLMPARHYIHARKPAPRHNFCRRGSSCRSCRMTAPIRPKPLKRFMILTMLHIIKEQACRVKYPLDRELAQKDIPERYMATRPDYSHFSLVVTHISSGMTAYRSCHHATVPSVRPEKRRPREFTASIRRLTASHARTALTHP